MYYILKDSAEEGLQRFPIIFEIKNSLNWGRNMNSRKFYLILCSVVSIFLFCAGIMVFAYINKPTAEGGTAFSEVLNNFKPDKEPVNVLVLVGDKEEQNTDTMLLVNYTPATGKLNMLTIPRDTRVKIKGSSIPKINSAYAAGGKGSKGATNSCQVVADLLGVNINYYIYFNISSFRNIVDLLGGVDFYVPDKLDYDDPVQNLHIHLEKGQQHLDGDKAEQLLRFRHYNTGKVTKYYDGSDLKRSDMQLKFIQEVIRQKVNVQYLSKINDILDVVFKNIRTNVTLNEAIRLSSGLNKLNSNEVKMFKLSGDDKKISSIWYYVYNNEILDVTTQEESDAKVILNEYFKCKTGFVNYTNQYYQPDEDEDSSPSSSNTKPISTKKTHKKDYTKNNPSNNGTSITGTTSPMP